jgi:PKD repeat protein
MTYARWSSLVLVLAALAVACGEDSPGGTGPDPDPDPNPNPNPQVNVAPSADFSRSCVYMQCDFTDASADPDGSLVAWNWNFGDGETSTDPNPVHVYAEPGDYTVTLTVTDDSSDTDSRSRDATAAQQVITSLTCEDATTPGGFVSCKLRLEEPSGFKVVLNSRNCEAHGNVFRITEPVADTLTVDGCYEEEGKEISHAGPFPAGTDISAEVIAPLLANPPALHVSGSYPEWTLHYEDGVDTDFDDLIMTVTALPAP